MVGKTPRIPIVLISNHEAQADSDPGHQGQDPGEDIGGLMPTKDSTNRLVKNEMH